MQKLIWISTAWAKIPILLQTRIKARPSSQPYCLCHHLTSGFFLWNSVLKSSISKLLKAKELKFWIPGSNCAQQCNYECNTISHKLGTQKYELSKIKYNYFAQYMKSFDFSWYIISWKKSTFLFSCKLIYNINVG